MSKFKISNCLSTGSSFSLFFPQKIAYFFCILSWYNENKLYLVITKKSLNFLLKQDLFQKYIIIYISK